MLSSRHPHQPGVLHVSVLVYEVDVDKVREVVGSLLLDSINFQL